ncbi:MAG: hypothetical protein R6X33_04605, partial [Candidatus Brocadiia bacterium]
MGGQSEGEAFSLAPAGLAAGTVVLRRGNGKTRVWSESTKGTGNKVLVDSDQIAWDLSDAGERSEFAAVKESLWVEGYDNNGTSTLMAEYEDPRGAKVTDHGQRAVQRPEQGDHIEPLGHDAGA